MFLLLAYCAAAQDAAAPVVLKDILVSEDQGHPRIELVLTAAIEASTSVASHPERLIIDLPNTIDGTNLPKMKVNSGGVRTIEILHSFTDSEHTRIVIELDRSLTYDVATADAHISFTFRPGSGAGPDGAVTAAKRGTLTGIFHRDKNVSVTQTETAQNTAAAAAGGALAGRQLSQPSSSGNIEKVKGPHSTGAVQSAETPQHSSSATAQQGTALAKSTDSSLTQSQHTNAGSTFPSTVLQQADVGATATPDSANATQQPTTTKAPASTVPLSPATDIEPARQSEEPPVKAAASPAPAITPSNANETAEAPATSTATAPEPRLVIRAADPSLRTVFRVKYVAEGVAYLDGGRSAGLKEGVKLEIREADLPARDGAAVAPSDPRVVAELEVSGLAENSSVTDIHDPKRPVKPGDLAYLSSADADALVQANALSPTRSYPAVVSFTEDDPEDEEVRGQIPRPPLPSVNRARGQIGFDYMDTASHGTNTVNSSAIGMMFRGDITRIGGTYWNLSGYWRGRLTKESAAAQKTLQETLNRTYHLNMTYDNPNSSIVAGFGRLYLPWAPSLDTLDGGYFGTRLSKGSVLGIFGGSTPDPSSWDYSPNRAIGGAFVNFEGGDYNAFHYSATTGGGISMVKWVIDRPFLFFEDSLSYKRTFAIYESAQLDSPRGNSVTPSPGPGLGRNFFTFRVNPIQRVELDANYNYFRDVPTFDPTLIGTSLLDKYLFQGFSAGGRVEIIRQVWVSTNLGRSTGTGDAKASLNQMYGLTFNHLPYIGLRADVHYSRFNSSFGDGHYESVSLSRQMNDHLRLEALIGQQQFASTITTNNRSRFLTGTIETTLGPHYYLQSNFTTNRGDLSYDQFMFSVGYRFDTRRKRE